jgi:hypothetical protein
MVFSVAAIIEMCDRLLDLIDAGSTDPTGDFALFNVGNTLLAVLPFSATAFAGSANVSGDITAAANTISPSSAPTPGVIAYGQWRNRNNTAVLQFTMGESAEEMVIGESTIPSDATSVTCPALSFILDAAGA